MRVLGEKGMYKMFWYTLLVIIILETIVVTVPQQLKHPLRVSAKP
jgi:hypothetical protein